MAVHLWNDGLSKNELNKANQQMATLLEEQELIDVSFDIIPMVKMGTSTFKFLDTAKSFFHGTRYSDSVIMKMSRDKMHNFPHEVEAFESMGTKTLTKGGDGRMYERLEIRGSYQGRDGVFEFIKNNDNIITHRFFNPRR